MRQFMSDKYILDSHGNPVPCENLMAWGQWMEVMDRRVAYTSVYGVRVSTVFLGLDHNFFSDGPPILFETMVFGGKHDQYQDRYYTRQEAEQGHINTVEMVRDRWLILLLTDGLLNWLKRKKDYILNYARRKGIYTPKWERQLKKLSDLRSTNGLISTKAEKK